MVQLDTALTGLKEHQISKDQTIDELKKKIHECTIKKKRADSLLKGLSQEKQKWIVCMRVLNQKYGTVLGDVLLSAGYISMLGGLT